MKKDNKSYINVWHALGFSAKDARDCEERAKIMCLILSYVKGMSVAKVAAVLGISWQTAEKLLRGWISDFPLPTLHLYLTILQHK